MPFLTTSPTSSTRPVIDEMSSGVPVSDERDQAARGGQRRPDEHDQRVAQRPELHEQDDQHERGAPPARRGSARGARPRWTPPGRRSRSARRAAAARRAGPRATAVSAAPRSPIGVAGGHHERRAQAVAAEHAQATAADRTSRPDRAAARAARTRSASARAPRPSSGSRRGSAGARRSRAPGRRICADLAALDGDLRDRRRPWPRRGRAARRCSRIDPRAQDRDRALAPVEHVDQLGALLERRAGLLGPRVERGADRRRARGPRSARGSRRDRRARPGAPARTRTAPRAPPCEPTADVVDHVARRCRAAPRATSRTMMSPSFCSVAVAGPSSVPVRRVNVDDLGVSREHGVDLRRRSGRSPRARSPAGSDEVDHERALVHRGQEAGREAALRRERRRRAARRSRRARSQRWRTSQRDRARRCGRASERPRLRLAAASAREDRDQRQRHHHRQQRRRSRA